ncbi:MAG: QueT transporter family protein [Lachnospiraceae bacterium]|nr:QueT transporter family protein [Lachnospiraceae bacterium]
MKTFNPVRMVQAAAVAALYVVLTILSNSLGLASGIIQVRISEALCVLPFFSPSLSIGLYIGCILANLITGCAPWDIVFGSFATLIGALVCAWIGTKAKGLAADSKAYKRLALLSPVPNVISNTLIVPPILIYVYGMGLSDVSLITDKIYPFQSAYILFTITVFLGEVISGYVFGILLFPAFHRVMRRSGNTEE